MGRTWDDEAADWVRWARTPGHDAYWYYSPAFFEEIVPPPGRRTLDLGCGEGRVARDLTARGHSIVGVDASPTLLRHAQEADPDGSYVAADAASLPFEDGSFDLVVAYNSLMDVDDLPGSVREAARVLEPGGSLCICITHPVSNAGRFTERAADAAFVIRDSYLLRRRLDETFTRGDLSMTFHGWLLSMEAYARALESAGFVIERLREPPAPSELVEHDPAEARWQRVPVFLFLRTRLLPDAHQHSAKL
jgi:ubiquinone/menaquinone biosynthesis C-methylase UbiE